MSTFSPLFSKESLEILRSKKLLILLIIFGFTAISSPIIAKIIPDVFKNINTNGIVLNIPEPTWRDAIDQFVKNTSQFGLIMIIFMFGGAVAEEKNKKTLEMLLTKPVSRTNFILSKFIAGAFYLAGSFILSALVFYFYAMSLFGTFNLTNFALLTLFLLIYLITIFSLTVFFSAISKSQIMAAGLSFIVSIVFTTVVGYIKAISKYSPSYIISNYKDLVIDGNYSPFLPPMYVSLAIVVVLIFLAIIFFSKQEVER